MRRRKTQPLFRESQLHRRSLKLSNNSYGEREYIADRMWGTLRSNLACYKQCQKPVSDPCIYRFLLLPCIYVPWLCDQQVHWLNTHKKFLRHWTISLVCLGWGMVGVIWVRFATSDMLSLRLVEKRERVACNITVKLQQSTTLNPYNNDTKVFSIKLRVWNGNTKICLQKRKIWVILLFSIHLEYSQDASNTYFAFF